MKILGGGATIYAAASGFVGSCFSLSALKPNCCCFQIIQVCSENRTNRPSQWNSVQRQDFFQRSPIDECQRIQAVNAGNLIFAFDAVQTTGSNHKCRLPMLFRKCQTCPVNLTHRPSKLLTDRPQFCTRTCLPLPSALGHERL